MVLVLTEHDCAELHKQQEATIAKIIETDYALGRVIDLKQLYGGCTHLSFAVTTWHGGSLCRYFFRKYRNGTTARAIEFEHAMIRHLISHGAQRVAGPVQTRHDRSYVRRIEPCCSGPQQRFYAVFDYVHGEDNYSWTENDLSDDACRDAATALAELHHASMGFMRNRVQRPDEPVVRFLPKFRKLLEHCARLASGSEFDECFQGSLEFMLPLADRTSLAYGHLARLPSIGIHGDFHPGNLKYFSDRVTGVFDFDRANIDLRMYDVALAIIYFCSAWGGEDDGQLLLDRAAVFLQAYQSAATRLGSPGRLTAEEARHFHELLTTGSLALLKWVTADSYYAKNVECEERLHLFFLQHIINLNQWVDTHQDDLADLARRIL